jgi:hypothetical protein
MAFEKESKYGIIKIEGKTIKLYVSQTSCSVMNIGSEIKDARWSGNVLLVYLADGKIRRYSSQTSYSTIS